MSELTTVQKNVLRYVQERVQAGLPPTRAQIAQHFMWRSANAAQEHLAAIARKGYIRLIGGARGIELVNKNPAVCVYCEQPLPIETRCYSDFIDGTWVQVAADPTRCPGFVPFRDITGVRLLYTQCKASRGDGPKGHCLKHVADPAQRLPPDSASLT